MGLITGLLTLPLAPVRGTMWIAEQVQLEAERYLDEPAQARAELARLVASVAAGTELVQDLATGIRVWSERGRPPEGYFTKRTAQAWLRDVLDQAERGVLPGMVKLVKQHRKARMGRNPATGEAIKIPAKTVVKARIAKQLKDAVLPRK